MTDRIALALGAIIVALAAADLTIFHWGATLFLARKVFDFIDFLEFWR